MLSNIFRAVFIVIVLAVLFVSVSSTEIAGSSSSREFWAIVITGLVLTILT